MKFLLFTCSHDLQRARFSIEMKWGRCGPSKVKCSVLQKVCN